MESVGIIIFNKQFGFDGIGRNYHFFIKKLIWMESVGIFIFNKEICLDGIGRNIYF